MVPAGYTRKLSSLDAFKQGLGLDATTAPSAAPPEGGFGMRRMPGLREFTEQRRSFLLKPTEPKTDR